MKKTELLNRAKSILNRYALNETLGVLDFDFMMGILECHPEAEKKIGCGVASIVVSREEVFGTRHFEIIRTDGSREDFSYIKSLQKDNLHHKDVIKAFRWAVIPQVKAFKNTAYGNKDYVRCAITNLNVRQSDCHIDHQPPSTFDALVFGFLSSRGLSIRNIEVAETGTVAGLTLKDQPLLQEWQNYHAMNARLRVTLNKANLGQSKVFVDWSKLEKTGETVSTKNETCK